MFDRNLFEGWNSELVRSARTEATREDCNLEAYRTLMDRFDRLHNATEVVRPSANPSGDFRRIAGFEMVLLSASELVSAILYRGNSWPDCSRTMYSAYQSGQLGSAFPVLDSCQPCAAAARCNAFERSATELYVVSPATRPGRRAVTSCNSQRLPSGSLKVANER